MVLQRSLENREYRKQKILGTYQLPYVDATGTRRRVQALMVVGYDIRWICEHAGISWKTGEMVIAKGQKRVLRTTEASVRRLYDDWWDKPRVGWDKSSRITVTMTKNRARQRGYAPPMAWDDDTIDDPQAKPADARYLDYADRCRLARELLAEGYNRAAAAKAALLSRATVTKIQRDLAA